MDARKAAELLDEYLRNELSPEEHAEIERLLEEDADLRRKRDQLRSYFEAIESLPSIQASDSFLEEVHRKAKRRRFFPALPLEIVGVAVTVGFLILIVNPFSPKVQNESSVVRDMIETKPSSDAQIVEEQGSGDRVPASLQLRKNSPLQRKSYLATGELRLERLRETRKPRRAQRAETKLRAKNKVHIMTKLLPRPQIRQCIPATYNRKLNRLTNRVRMKRMTREFRLRRLKRHRKSLPNWNIRPI